MSRPTETNKPYEMQVSFACSAETRKQLRIYAAKRDVTVSTLLRNIVLDLLKEEEN